MTQPTNPRLALRVGADAQIRDLPTNPRLALIVGADAQIRDLLDRYRQATRDAGQRIGADSRLTTEGKAAALRNAYADIQSRFSTELANLRARVTGAVDQLSNTAAGMLPKPVPGVEGILGRQAWWARSRSLFEAGKRTQDIIASATSPEQLHSLRDELPTAVAAGIAEGYGDLELLDNLIDRRMAELVSPAAVAAHDLANEGEIALAGLTPSLQYAEAEVTGRAPEGGGLTSAIAGSVARQQAARRLRPVDADLAGARGERD